MKIKTVEEAEQLKEKRSWKAGQLKIKTVEEAEQLKEKLENRTAED